MPNPERISIHNANRLKPVDLDEEIIGYDDLIEYHEQSFREALASEDES